MSDKIEWYKEVLELEPASRLFFPLAKMLAQEGRLEEACSVLDRGLALHGEFFEARLLYVDVLHRLGRTAECSGQIAVMGDLLARYEQVWRVWASALEGGRDDDAAATLRLVSAFLSGRRLRFSDLLRRGLESVEAEDGAGAPRPAVAQPGETLPGREERAPAHVLSAPRAASAAGEEERVPQAAAQAHGADGHGRPQAAMVAPRTVSLRTRSMAELLADQGDVPAALDIYAELLAAASDGKTRAELEARIAALGGEAVAPAAGTAPAGAASAPSAADCGDGEACGGIPAGDAGSVQVAACAADCPDDGPSPAACEGGCGCAAPVRDEAAFPGGNASLIGLLEKLAERIEARAHN